MGKPLSSTAKKRELFLPLKSFFSYSSSFIENEYRKFFNEYITSSPLLLPFIDNEDKFFRMRQTLLGQQKAHQSQVTNNVARSIIYDNPRGQEPTEPLPKQNQKSKAYGEQIIIHYTHEKSLIHLNEICITCTTMFSKVNQSWM